MRRLVFLSFFALLFSLGACSSDTDPDTASCPEGQQRCGESCVDVETSAEHCGACGSACGAEEACREGVCAPLCTEGEELCDGACVDPAKDRQNCGGCGVVCDEGEVCSAGVCSSTCDEGLRDCDGSCVDVSSDDENCGSCGEVCGEGERCEAGTCGCAPGWSACDEGCADLENDTENCGACGEVCGEGQSCEGGECLCPEGLTLCDGRCVDTDDDSLHCGGCGTACGEEQSCDAGVCTCPDGLSACGTECLDLDEDLENCGACGEACPAGDAFSDFVCEEGACVLLCSDGWDDCDDNPSTFCETNVTLNPSHCGGCGIACRGDQVCQGGSCICPAGLTECEGACIDLQADSLHCGACGITCEAGESCSNGLCCAAGETGCDGRCVDFATDAEHCGACGDTCLGHPHSTDAVCVDADCVLACEGERLDCNGERGDGCEVDPYSDPDHCGACDNFCSLRSCVDGSCAKVVALGLNTHSCAVVSDGQVYCWGNDPFGTKLGTGQVSQLQPNPVLDEAGQPLLDVVEVDGGFGHNCGRTSGGEVLCWGLATERGNPDVPGSAPVRVKDPEDPSGLLGDVVQIAANDRFTCARTSTGAVKCWGLNNRGQLGDGTTDNQGQAVSVIWEDEEPLVGTVHIAAGREHACAILADKRIACWGNGDDGRLGTDTTSSSHPRVVADPDGVLVDPVELALGGRHSCARLASGEVACWGSNHQQQLGNGAGNARPEPVLVNGLTGADQLRSTGDHNCVRLTDGRAQCWGYNGNGEIGQDTAGGFIGRPAFVLDPEDTKEHFRGIDEIATGSFHTCAIRGTDLYCWGSNSEGTLGDGTQDNRHLPTLVNW